MRLYGKGRTSLQVCLSKSWGGVGWVGGGGGGHELASVSLQELGRGWGGGTVAKNDFNFGYKKKSHGPRSGGEGGEEAKTA